MDPKTFLEWLSQFVEVLKNPHFLIFFCSLIVGWVIKNTEIPIKPWLIPSILAAIGLVAGGLLLGGGFVGRFQGALTGMTLSLSTVGLHQVYAQFKNRSKDAVISQ